MGVREVRWYSRQGVILTMFLICTNNTIVSSSLSSRLLLTVLLLSVLRQPVLQTFNFRSLLVDNCLRALKSISHEEDQTFWVALHLVGVIWTGRWAGDRKERITEVTL